MEDSSDYSELGSNPLAIWEHINRFYRSTRKAVNLLVGNNCDAASASLTLMSLLKSSLISFSVHPLSSYDELAVVVEGMNVAQDFSKKEDGTVVEELFVLLGVGGPIPLEHYFNFSRHIVILLDSHRPIHLSNLRKALRGDDKTRMIVWGSSKMEEDVDSFFNELIERENRKRRRQQRREAARKRRLIHSTRAAADRVEAEEEELSDESSIESSESDEEDQEVEHDHEDLLPRSIDWISDTVPASMEKQYESSSGNSKSCAVELYDLSTLLNRMNDTFLWHAAVGVCDLLRRRCVDYAAYLVEMRPLHDAVALHQSSRRLGLHTSAPGGLGEISINTSHVLRETSSNALRLMNVDEPQLFLLQHISLWEAMWNDPVVASALGFHHTESGESTLKLLLARCGVSLEMAQRPWFEVPKDERESALHLIQDGLKVYFRESQRSLTSSPSSIRGVSKAIGFSREVSTSDVCVLFDAILAAYPPLSLYAMEEDSTPHQKLGARRLEEFFRTQFWKAHAIIDMDPNQKDFTAAIADAVFLHRMIGDATSALMQPGIILSTQGLHYLQLSDPGKTASALETFHTAARLDVLANRLLHTLTAERGLSRSTRAVRPLLLSAPVPRVTQRRAAEKEGTAAGDEDETLYLLLLSSAGQTGLGLMYSKPRAIFNDCVEKKDAFDVRPTRSAVNRQCTFLVGRENAVHLTEMMHLRSLES